MKLKTICVRDFQSVRDSGEFSVGDITCLVGKNESGKTSLLKALYHLNPLVPNEGSFDVTEDYPRNDVEDYRHDVAAGRRKHAVVIQATYELSDIEKKLVAAQFGDGVLSNKTITLTKDYDNKRTHDIKANFGKALHHLVKNANLPPPAESKILACDTLEKALAALKSEERTNTVVQLESSLASIQSSKSLEQYIWDKLLSALEPKYLYFDEYYEMRGRENIEQLKNRQSRNALHPSDHPMLGLIEMARLDLDQLINPSKTQELINKLEGAGNHLSKQVLKYWSQNRHLHMRFDVRPGRPGDPEGMQSGTNIWAQVFDSRHMVTTNLGTRSKGFVWFFSFLAWYSQLKRRKEPVILLLDEPGLSLHARAQADLLRYFEEELLPHHQIIYTTHSPFMVDSSHFERVRIVQDRGIDKTEPLPPSEDGTKVLSDVLLATDDSLFPLQGALGYEIHQSLFVGPCCLVVEGVSDLLYIQTMSQILERKHRVGLSPKWTITPVGGADKVPTFVSLLGSQSGVTIATLLDVQAKDRQNIDNLYKRKLLQKKNVLTYAEFTSQSEADVEDMFDLSFYLKLVNSEFKDGLSKVIKASDFKSDATRITQKISEFLKTAPLGNGIQFSHYRSARYFVENSSSLEKDLSDDTLNRFENVFKRINALLEA